MSTTVTTAFAVLSFPFTSVTVRTTSLAPSLAHVKSVISRAREATPQLSNEALFISAAVVEALPSASR
ncbi:MAG: hypothetical protein K0B11_21255 [Mariniphaga sp.]|nr:hypothetical protein [Mariniphaga sp.]